MKKYIFSREGILFWKHFYNKIFILIILFIYYIVFKSCIECIEFASIRKDLFFYEEAFKSISIFYPSIIGILAVMHIGIEYNQKTIYLRMVHENFSDIVKYKAIFNMGFAGFGQLVFLSTTCIITQNLPLRGIIAATVLWIWCCSIILLGYLVVILSHSETVGLAVMISYFILENRFAFKYTLKNTYMSFVNSMFTTQYTSIKILIVFIVLFVILSLLLKKTTVLKYLKVFP